MPRDRSASEALIEMVDEATRSDGEVLEAAPDRRRLVASRGATATGVSRGVRSSCQHRHPAALAASWLRAVAGRSPFKGSTRAVRTATQADERRRCRVSWKQSDRSPDGSTFRVVWGAQVRLAVHNKTRVCPTAQNLQLRRARPSTVPGSKQAISAKPMTRSPTIRSGQSRCDDFRLEISDRSCTRSSRRAAGRGQVRRRCSSE